MRKILLSIISVALVLSLTACSHTNSGDGTSPTNQTNQASIQIDDIAWTVDEGILEGDRYILMDYTNNTPYTIASLEITFTEKESITEDDKTKFYDDLKTTYDMSDDDIERLKEEKIGMHAESEIVTEPGESVTNAYCYYYQGSYYLKNSDHFNLVEPDIATIRYLNNGEILTAYYDFHSQKYSNEPETEVADQWPTSDLATHFPKPETKIISLSIENDNSFSVYVYGISLEQFNTYVETCKTQGFTSDPGEFEGFYSAENAEGYSVYLSYRENSHSFYASFDAPDGTSDAS